MGRPVPAPLAIDDHRPLPGSLRSACAAGVQLRRRRAQPPPRAALRLRVARHAPRRRGRADRDRAAPHHGHAARRSIRRRARRGSGSDRQPRDPRRAAPFDASGSAARASLGHGRARRAQELRRRAARDADRRRLPAADGAQIHSVVVDDWVREQGPALGSCSIPSARWPRQASVASSCRSWRPTQEPARFTARSATRRPGRRTDTSAARSPSPRC